MKFSHFFGGVLLIAGTTIGVGMLGLPVITAFMGFFPSLILFFVCWLFMLCTGLYFVDVNCSIKGESNLITMAERTLGPWGRAVSWIVYLLLLYSLMAAYIAASAPLFMKAFEAAFMVPLPAWVAKFALPVLFGGFIYLGTSGVDWINRLLMAALVISYILLIVFIPSKMEGSLLMHTSWSPFVYAAPVVLTSFGYHIIIPSLATYVDHDRKLLYKMVIVGSLVALFVNVIWQLLVLGTVPLTGKEGLAVAWLKGLPATGPLAAVVKTGWLATGAYFFSFFAIITSFLGVALSLADFLTDGLRIKKSWEGRLLAIALTFLPPLIFVYSYQRGFLLALEYAGAFVAILLIFLPAAMAWKLKKPKFYKTAGGRALLSATMCFSLFIVVVNFLIRWGIFENMFKKIAMG